MGRISNVIKKPKRKFLLHGYFVNDLEYVDNVHLAEKLNEQGRFSVLYIILLASSVLVCTLGLLTNSSAIVIGGMLIAPLMWPLERMGFGIAHRSSKHMYHGFIITVASIFVGTLSAYLITSLSPLKVINAEILARTAPTLMDLFIALAAGFVAAIAITQKKIADSLAGVAIATSLMPPLCAVGISLALHNWSYSAGALLLFAINAACITFIATVVFIWNQHARKEKIHIATRAALTNIIIVLLLAVPLVQFLRSYSFELQSYGAITSQLKGFAANKYTSASFENINVKQTDRSTLSVTADLLLPSGLQFTYEDNDKLVNELENVVDKEVLLNLRIQEIVEPVSKDQREKETFISSLKSAFEQLINSLEPSLKVKSSEVVRSEDGVWLINAEVLASAENVPTAESLEEINQNLTQRFDRDVRVEVSFLPSLSFQSSEQVQSVSARQIVEATTDSYDSNAQVLTFEYSSEPELATIHFSLAANKTWIFGQKYLEDLKNSLQQYLNRPVTLQVKLVKATDISI